MIGDYTIPDEIKELITYDFLKEFRRQLFAVFDFSLNTYGDFLYGIESTRGWETALHKACDATGKQDIWKYWSDLEWYDSDCFDDELSDMLIESRLILPTINDIMTDYLDIDPEELRVCDNCGGTFTKDMIVEAEYDLHLSHYICKYCDTHKEV